VVYTCDPVVVLRRGRRRSPPESNIGAVGERGIETSDA
jgi:hypothetical protein